jgi:hypothetical protein
MLAATYTFSAKWSTTITQAFRGDVMKKCTRTLVAIAFVLGLTGAIKAEGEEGVVVNLPFEFVVGAKTLPAGTYTVRNFSVDKSGTLILSNRDSGTSTFVLPYLDESDLTGKPELSFQQIGDRYFLSAVQTAATLYRIHVLDSSVDHSATKSGSSNTASVSHGGK